MLSAQLELGSASKAVHARTSHGQHIDPFTNTSKASVFSVPFYSISRTSTLSSVQNIPGEVGIVRSKQNNSHTK